METFPLADSPAVISFYGAPLYPTQPHTPESGKPPPNFDLVRPALPLLARLLFSQVQRTMQYFFFLFNVGL